MTTESAPHLLIVEARFYDEMSNALLEGATDVLKEAGASYDVTSVLGALEIPATIAMALDHMDMGGTTYDGFIALGIIIRGESYHFEIVANESARGITQLSISESLALGNGIMTVENEDQAWRRVKKDQLDKGGFAAQAALKMIKIKQNFASALH